MIERDMRQKLVALLKKDTHAIAVENGGCHPGTPDINCSLGWIECKATNEWPARSSTPVRLDHPITPGQRIFMHKRARVNGRAWVMLNISGEWLLFDGIIAAEYLGKATRAELYELALRCWKRTPTTEELLEILTP